MENTIDILFAEETELFSGSNTDGKNFIQQNNELSLCDRALDICCHRKTIELHGETVTDTTKSTTTATLESTLVSYLHKNEKGRSRGYPCVFKTDPNP